VKIVRELSLLRRAACPVLVLAASVAAIRVLPAQAQSALERTYAAPQADVQSALRELRAFSGARLPALEGFVASGAVPLRSFEHPYYQFQIDLTSVSSGQTLVRVSAKITAWYSDKDPARSEYRTLPSNGRLETDLLDRLGEYLKSKTSSLPAKPGPQLPVQAPPRKDQVAQFGRAGPSPSNSLPDPNPSVVDPRRAGEPAAPTEDQIAELRSRRESTEQQIVEVRAQVAELENTLKSQVSPSNLAAIKVARAILRDQPDDAGHILFRADAQDEFEVVEKRGNWIRVRAERLQAWLRRSDASLLDEERPAGAGAAPAQPAPELTVTRAGIDVFSGEWAPLKGKKAMIVWVRAGGDASATVPGRQKLEYAKRVFAERYPDLLHSQAHAAGVVIIFDMADGGVAAATVESIRQWREGQLADADFLRRCSVNPPGLFREVRTN
jgi:hypothetical protein